MGSCKVHCIPEMATCSTNACEEVPCCSLDRSPRTSSKRELFTVWMKSLIMQGYGCTVFNESGEVIYRMDNYDTRRSRKVYLMDLRGRVLFTILKRKFQLFGCWEGHKSGWPGPTLHYEKAWFRVRKHCGILKKSFRCEVIFFCGKTQRGQYDIEGFTNRPEFNIKNSIGAVIAEVNRKQTSSGIYFGEDVWSGHRASSKPFPHRGSGSCLWLDKP